MNSQPRNAIENGFTSQLMPTVTAIPRQCRATVPMAPKSTRSNIGTIISQISTATGRLTLATLRLPNIWKGAGATAPRAIPATMQSATQRVR